MKCKTQTFSPFIKSTKIPTLKEYQLLNKEQVDTLVVLNELIEGKINLPQLKT